MNEEYNVMDPDAQDWDDEITSDGDEYVTLPEGEYEFEVIGFDRDYFNGSGKIPACNKAGLTFRVFGPNGEEARAFENIFLHKKFEWKKAAFFRSIGQKRRGEALKPDWNAVLGAHGRAEFSVHEYNGRTSNQVKRYIDAPEKPSAAAQAKAAVSSADQPDVNYDELPF